jgi:hypothetical protein
VSGAAVGRCERRARPSIRPDPRGSSTACAAMPSRSAGFCPKPRLLPGGARTRCKSRRCVSCGVLWAGDTRVRILQNVEAYGGPVVLVTITGPGDDRLPRGEDGRVLVGPREGWNRSAPDRWRKLHRAAAERARRKHGRFSLVAWSWEYQRRGVLHKHVILGVATARELAAAHTYVQALDELRHRHDFGFVDRGRKHKGGRALEVVPAVRAGRYVAKYLAKRQDGRIVLSETVLAVDVPPLVVYVARTLTTRTGVTMRSLRWRRHVQVLGFDPKTGETAASSFMSQYRRLAACGVRHHRVGDVGSDDAAP